MKSRDCVDTHDFPIQDSKTYRLVYALFSLYSDINIPSDFEEEKELAGMKGGREGGVEKWPSFNEKKREDLRLKVHKNQQLQLPLGDWFVSRFKRITLETTYNF